MYQIGSMTPKSIIRNLKGRTNFGIFIKSEIGSWLIHITSAKLNDFVNTTINILSILTIIIFGKKTNNYLRILNVLREHYKDLNSYEMNIVRTQKVKTTVVTS